MVKRVQGFFNIHSQITLLEINILLSPINLFIHNSFILKKLVYAEQFLISLKQLWINFLSTLSILN